MATEMAGCFPNIYVHFTFAFYLNTNSIARILSKGKRESGEQKFPAGSRGRAPLGSGGETPEARDSSQK